MHPSSHIHSSLAHDISSRRISAAANDRAARRARRAAAVEGDAPSHSPLPRLRFLFRRPVARPSQRLA